jgi:nucleotide-binding universal stress UspA family protein
MSDPLRVLIPSDGSDPSRRAVAHVLSLAARGLLVDVHLLNVQSAVRGSAASLVSPRDLEDYHRDEGMLALAESIRQIESAGLKPHAHVSVGDPGEVILAFAERLHSEQIVMGTHGRGLVGTFLLGSVAQHVVVHATLPVTLLR